MDRKRKLHQLLCRRSFVFANCIERDSLLVTKAVGVLPKPPHCGNSAAPIRRVITPARCDKYADPRCSSKYFGRGNITASRADCHEVSFDAEVL